MTDYTQYITSQHNQRQRFVDTVFALTDMAQAIRDVIDSIPGEFDLDTAVGAQLDIIGLWVGQSRYLKDALPGEFFGFHDTPNALGFGELGMPNIGGRWLDIGNSSMTTSTLNDVLYRMLLRARIVKNHYRGGFAGIIAGAAQIFGNNTRVSVTDLGNMAMRVNIGRRLSKIEQAMTVKLDIIPRPAGVLIDGLGFSDDEHGWLGFSDQVEYGAVTFAELGSVGPEHHLAEKFA